jgi:AcrR family transcriptional regulator
MSTLSERKNDLTRGMILEAALGLLQQTSVSDLTVRAVAQHADISERTVFRYFPSRDVLLDAVAGRVLAEMDLPAPPQTMGELLAAPRALYAAFEARSALTGAALHTDLVGRMRALQAGARWEAVSRLIDQAVPEADSARREIAAANICFHLAASTWHYYRNAFGFGLETCVACAEAAVRQALDGLRRPG